MTLKKKQNSFNWGKYSINGSVIWTESKERNWKIRGNKQEVIVNCYLLQNDVYVSSDELSDLLTLSCLYWVVTVLIISKILGKFSNTIITVTVTVDQITALGKGSSGLVKKADMCPEGLRFKSTIHQVPSKCTENGSIPTQSSPGPRITHFHFTAEWKTYSRTVILNHKGRGPKLGCRQNVAGHKKLSVLHLWSIGLRYICYQLKTPGLCCPWGAKVQCSF